MSQSSPPPARPLAADRDELRAQVRAFLAAERAAGGFAPRSDAWMTGFDPAFTRRLAAHGWVGMTLPTRYGGLGASALDRVVVVEELLAAGAPVAAHWFAERQIGPAILKHGTDGQRERWLPRIAAGDAYFAIGLSEPDAGSDLASVRTAAARVDGGWSLTGTKVWSSGAHRAHAMVVLARSAAGSTRHQGLTQFIVELPDPGVTINPIVSISGEHHVNEVVFDAVFVPDGNVLGTVDGAWAQVVAELAFERSGPERYLSTMPLLDELAAAADAADPRAAEELGGLVASIAALRAMSLGVAEALERGEPPVVAAAMVKDLGTIAEQESVAVAARALSGLAGAERARVEARLDEAQIQSPTFTLRGGTNEVLRGIVAKELQSGGRRRPAHGPVAATVARMLADTAGAADRDGTGTLDPVWPLLVDAQLPWVGAPEAAGGAGGDDRDLAELIRVTAGSGRSTPLADVAFLAHWLLVQAGLDLPRGLAIPVVGPSGAPALDDSTGAPTITGLVPDIAWAPMAEELVVLVEGPTGPGAARVAAGEAVIGPARRTLAGEPVADVRLDAAPVLSVAPLPPSVGATGARARAALGRALALSGAMDAAVELCVAYCAQREQFGRPIGQFQAVAHRLALVAQEAAAASALVDAALASGAPAAAGAAKARAGVAAALVAQGAHQIHGAMGVSAEYPLGRLTTRLWAWSREHGDARFWHTALGARAAADGALWPAIESLHRSPAGAD